MQILNRSCKLNLCSLTAVAFISTVYLPGESITPLSNTKGVDLSLPTGSDVTQALRSAMERLQSPYVKLPAGTFYLAGCPSIKPISSTSILGKGSQTTILKLRPNSSCNSDIFTWVKSRDVHIEGVTIDLNGATQSTQQDAPFGFFGADGLIIRDVAVIGARGPNWNLLRINGGMGGRVTQSTFAFEAPSTSYNEAISVSNTFSPLNSFCFDHLLLSNSGSAFTPSKYVRFSHSEIVGWAYGGAVTVAVSRVDTAFMADNMFIHDSRNGADSNSTYPSGFEIHGFGAYIADSVVDHVASACVDLYAADSLATNVACTRWGQGGVRAGQAAFVIGYASASDNGNGAAFISDAALNTTHDPNSLVGFQDVARITTGSMKSNVTKDVKTPYKIDGGTVVVDIRSDLRVAQLSDIVPNRGSILSVIDASASTGWGGRLAGGGRRSMLAVGTGSAFIAH